MANNFMISLFESASLSNKDKGKLLDLYQEFGDPFTLSMAGFGVFFTTIVAIGVANEIKVKTALKKYTKLYPEIPEFKMLEEKVFPLSSYEHLPNINDAVKHPKLHKAFHSNNYRVYYYKGKPMFIFALGSSGWDDTAMFQPVNIIANKHADYYRICALRSSGLSDGYTMDFTKRVLAQDKPLDNIPVTKKFPQYYTRNTTPVQDRMHYQNMMNNMTMNNMMM